VCVPGMARYIERNVQELSEGCKSLVGELVKPTSKRQGGMR
jgi:hypothetical protein